MGRISPRYRSGWGTRIFPPLACMTAAAGGPRRARRLRWSIERDQGRGTASEILTPCALFYVRKASNEAHWTWGQPDVSNESEGELCLVGGKIPDFSLISERFATG